MSMFSIRRLLLAALSLSMVAAWDYAGFGPWPLAVGTAFAAAEVQPLEEHYQAARTALTRGDTDKAKLEVKLALRDNSLDAASHFLLADLLARQGEYDQAIVGFQRGLTVHPTNYAAIYNLATLLLRRGETVSASRLLENAVLIRSDYIPAYNNLAKAYFEAGLPELAVATYEEALRRDPSNAIARANLARLSEGTDLHASVALEQSPAPRSEARPDLDAKALKESLRDLPHVTVEQRNGRLTLTGWTKGLEEREPLNHILAERPDIIDKTTDLDDPNRLIEIDAIIFAVLRTDSDSLGFNFLQKITTNLKYFSSGPNTAVGTGTVANDTIGVVKFLPTHGWLLSAAATYDVNIANAENDVVALLARPYLTTLNGTPAKFVSGGTLIFKVTGNVGGDIKPYDFGTTLNVTPTLVSPGEDGSPRVHVKVEAGRTSLLALASQSLNEPSGTATFDRVNVTSEAVVGLNKTLILSGLSQRERTTTHSGVPILRDIPILKSFFSQKTTLNNDTSVIILLTPRDPAFWDEQNRRSLEEFVEMRRAYAQAQQGTAEDMRRFRERYPNSYDIPPNRFGSHFFLMRNSELYRAVSGQDLDGEDLDLDLLNPTPKEK